MHFLQGCPQRDESFSEHLVRLCVMALCLTTDEINLAHMAKVVSAGILHWEVIIFLVNIYNQNYIYFSHYHFINI
jgi:hypothetical protein